MAATIFNTSAAGLSTDWAFSNGDLTAALSSAPGGNVAAPCTNSNTAGAGGKNVYFEAVANTIGADASVFIGLIWANTTLDEWLGLDDYGPGWQCQGGVNINNNFGNTIASFSAGQRVRLAFNLSSQLFWGAVAGGSWNNSGTANPATGAGGISFAGGAGTTVYPAISCEDASDSVTLYFAETSFVYSLPSGFTTWNTSDAPNFSSILGWVDNEF